HQAVERIPVRAIPHELDEYVPGAVHTKSGKQRPPTILLEPRYLGQQPVFERRGRGGEQPVVAVGCVAHVSASHSGDAADQYLRTAPYRMRDAQVPGGKLLDLVGGVAGKNLIPTITRKDHLDVSCGESRHVAGRQ